jgi:hypothetical protein
MGCHKQKLKFGVLVEADGDALGGTVSRGPTQYDQQTSNIGKSCSSHVAGPRKPEQPGINTINEKSVGPRFVILRTTLRRQRREVPGVITSVALGNASQDRRT